jgi:hypothetical protein
MISTMANFCRERAMQCHEASQEAKVEPLRRYWSKAELRWRAAEAQWLKRFAAAATSVTQEENEKRLEPPREAFLAISGPPQSSSKTAITFERFSGWLEIARAKRAGGRDQPSPEDTAICLEQARASRNAADSSEEPETREYWLAAEAHWLSLANTGKDP